jgi:hypothetical protein
MKRYYFDDENQNIVDYSTYWYGTINVNNKQLNYSNLVHIKDIFETKYNIELEWLSIDENQIKLTIHRNMKYYYHQFEKDILSILKDIQRKCKFKIDNANFDACESKHDSNMYKYTIKKVNQVFKLIKKKLNIEKWNLKIFSEEIINLENRLQELDLCGDYLTIVGNIYLKDNNIQLNDICEITAYISKKHQISLKILLGLNAINIFFSDHSKIDSVGFEEFILDFMKYIELNYCVVNSSYFKFISNKSYKYIVFKEDDSFHFQKTNSSTIIHPYPTIWKGYLKNKKKKKNWLNDKKIKKIDEILAEKYDIMFYLYFDEQYLYFSICTDTYYYHEQFDNDILKMIHDIENILSVQFSDGSFEAWECRYDSNFYKYDFYLDKDHIKYDKSCINMINFDAYKKQKVK